MTGRRTRDIRVDYTSKEALERAGLDEYEDRRTRIDYTHLRRALECVHIAENENEDEDVEMKE